LKSVSACTRDKVGSPLGTRLEVATRAMRDRDA
jgi:hypothetical protein